MRALLAHRDARLFLAGQSLSLLGDTALWLALGLWVKELTGSSSAAGLVIRERSTEDERQVFIRLTDAGRALEQSGLDVSAAVLDALQLDLEQFTALKTQLEAITGRMNPSR